MTNSPLTKSLAITTAFTLSLIAAGFLFSKPVMAQATTGTLKGTVVDPNGGVVAGAEVIAKNQATGIETPTTTTASDGSFVITTLLPGKYTVQLVTPVPNPVMEA